MTNDPELIKAEIEVTRAELSRDVDTLAETVRPGNVVRRQKDKVASAVFGAKEAVMGTASEAQEASGDALESAGDAISSAPRIARQRTRGNPLAAGLVALGVGWLAGSILPTSRAERQMADTLKDQAQPLVQEVTDMAKETAQNLQEPAKEALEQVKATGAEAVEALKEEGSSAAADVADRAQEGARNVKESAQSGY